MSVEKDKKLRQALRLISSGKDVEGNRIDLLKIASDVGKDAREFARKLRQGQARTRQRFHIETMRFKG